MKTIMIIDGDRVNREHLSDLVHRLGYNPLQRSDARSALALVLKGSAVDAVITDYGLPGMNGLELVETMKHVSPSIPIILLAAYARTDIYLKALALGVTEYLEKPISAAVLKDVLPAPEDSH